jgi:hypothetical protein
LRVGNYDGAFPIPAKRKRRRHVVGRADGREKQSRRAKTSQPSVDAGERFREIGGQWFGLKRHAGAV